MSSSHEPKITTPTPTDDKNDDGGGTELDKEDEADHARVDDPIVAPARLVPSANKATVVTARTTTATTTVTSCSSESILTRLYDPDRKLRPALWEHIKLVAPGPAAQPPDGLLKWRYVHNKSMNYWIIIFVMTMCFDHRSLFHCSLIYYYNTGQKMLSQRIV
jgi:hypothetical protein